MSVLELIKCLINQPGVDVNVRGLNGKTPLHYAVEINELSMVALLLNRKNINPLITDDDGKSALSCAREEILQALINHKYGWLCCIATYERLTIARIISNLLKILFFCNQSDQI